MVQFLNMKDYIRLLKEMVFIPHLKNIAPILSGYEVKSANEGSNRLRYIFNC